MTHNNNKPEIIPANSEIPCGCCGRLHRKIKKVDGVWMGQTCEEQYKLYLVNKDINSWMWRGYERQHKKIALMVSRM